MDPTDGIAEHLPRLRRYARALTRDPAQADDLVQDCVERALVKIHLFQPGTDLRAWLFTIMHNVHVNFLRKQTGAPGSVPLETLHEPPALPPAQEDALSARDMASALLRLPVEQRQVVLLVGLEDMSYKQTAEVLDVPVGTVMSRLARGREKLRELMEGNGAPSLRRVK